MGWIILLQVLFYFSFLCTMHGVEPSLSGQTHFMKEFEQIKIAISERKD